MHSHLHNQSIHLTNSTSSPNSYQQNNSFSMNNSTSNIHQTQTQLNNNNFNSLTNSISNTNSNNNLSFSLNNSNNFSRNSFNTPLINIGQFKVLFQQLFQVQPDAILQQQNADIDTEDALFIPHFEKINTIIDREVPKFETVFLFHPKTSGTELVENPRQPNAEAIRAVLATAVIPTIESLEDQAKCDLRTLKVKQYDPTKRTKKKRRQINYVTEKLLQESRVNGFEQVDSSEIIVSISFHHPKTHKKQQEFLVLGSQPLFIVRDMFYCILDHLPMLNSKDAIEANPITFENTRSTRHSGYFLIENTFYTDLRHPDAIDYSQSILQWVEENKTNLHRECGTVPNFERKDMATSLNEISVRIGMPYIYMHQGDCEHVIVFNDIRFVTDQDNQNGRAYPVLTFRSKIRKRKCNVCDIHPAKFVTFEDKLAPESPSFFCQKCYQQLHYDFEGRLLYDDFEVYPYFHE
eukprot:TRINITY_DN2335_c0_g1_i2.p1 TRINITY_DN2335_c0_g1~~TRINITY_DN2335_c0_g1_i2.p1  ORF type:complete len:485 (+),score=169.70 TRINITY_DN2335_c0_g1_i2:64-1455(+)